MSKIFIRTLNGIRSALSPSGRDVAEAMDDISAAFQKLSAQTNTIEKTVASAPATSAVSLAKTNPPVGIGQPTAPQGVTSVTGDGVVIGNNASTGAVELVLEPVSPNLFLAGPPYGVSGVETFPWFRAIETVDLPVTGDWPFFGVFTGVPEFSGAIADNTGSRGTNGQVLTAGAGGAVLWASGASGLITSLDCNSPYGLQGGLDCGYS